MTFTEQPLQPLIPGLPDSVALNCLLRVPVDNHAVLKGVCREWYDLFSNKTGQYFARRKELSFFHPWLFVFAYNESTQKLRLMACDLTNFAWLTLSDLPYTSNVSPHGFRSVALPHEGVIYLCGGTLSNKDHPIGQTYKYEVRSNSWKRITRMITSRSYFGTGVIDGKIYIAGGNSTGLFKVKSTEVMDPSNGKWQCVASMEEDIASYDAVVLDGKFYVVESWCWSALFGIMPSGQVYDPRANSWEDMPYGMRTGWRGLSVVIEGRLFLVSECYEKGNKQMVKVYEEEKDEWEEVEGTELEMSGPFRVSCCNDQIIVVAKYLDIAIGTVKRKALGKSCNPKFYVEWEVVESPSPLSKFSPSSAEVMFA